MVLFLTDGLLTNGGLNFFINPVNDPCEVSENFQVNGLLYFKERFSINRRINLFLDFAVGPSDHMPLSLLSHQRYSKNVPLENLSLPL